MADQLTPEDQFTMGHNVLNTVDDLLAEAGFAQDSSARLNIRIAKSMFMDAERRLDVAAKCAALVRECRVLIDGGSPVAVAHDVAKQLAAQIDQLAATLPDAPRPRHLVRRGLRQDGTYPESDNDDAPQPASAAIREELDPLTALNDAAGTTAQLAARLRLAMNFIEEWSNWWSYALGKDDNEPIPQEEREAAEKMAASLGERACDMVIDNRRFMAAAPLSEKQAIPLKCATCGNAITQGNVDACTSGEACPFHRYRRAGNDSEQGGAR